MSVAAELAERIRISNPKPDRCAACFAGADADLRFVDFDAAIDRGTIVDKDTSAVLESIDNLHLCEPCVRAAAQALALRPDLHQRQVREIKKLELDVEHWKQYAKDLEAALGQRPDPVPTRRRRVNPAAT